MPEIISEETENYDGFHNSLQGAAELFDKIPKKESIRLIGHLDSDGLCSSAIMINAMMKQNRRYTLTILPTITDDTLKNLVDEDEKYFVFVDLGSSNLESLSTVLRSKNIFVLDHHVPQTINQYKNIVHVNPHLYGIDGSNEISGAGVVFLFCYYLTGKNNLDMSRIAIVGAIGDVQENDGFRKLNSEILDIAISNNLIEVRKGLKFFGVQTKPIYKLLQYGSDIFIPGITGSESGSINFLTSLGIDPKNKKGWKKVADLTDEEKKKLIAGIIMKRSADVKISDIISNNYLLIGEEEDSPFRDAKEFSTLLNSCGRLEKASIGIGACLNDKRMKQQAVENLIVYRKEIVNALNWYKDNSNSENIIRGKHFIIINAGEEILPTMIGTLGSILSKNADIEKNIFILSMARNYDGTSKISLRISGNPENANLKEIMSMIIERINNGSSGGHVFAAGAVIDTDKEDELIKVASEILENYSIEENI